MRQQHKFKVGQTVNFRPGRSNMAITSREYKIIRLLPAVGGQPQYRIKSTGEPFERVAQENNLS
ncbi:hypothetical protein SAMN04488061_0716 [Filomicrobium insigne]|uniref:Cold-shock protein n=1 Tax=Filomicrobium insigne TaxID=418854 RepID=A0A1H0I371_9HYPH|nr:hypothetical protein SAMN04488061_0716 [Filomicrobium insigne]